MNVYTRLSAEDNMRNSIGPALGFLCLHAATMICHDVQLCVVSSMSARLTFYACMQR